ncbi:MAG: D-isomer specific 2-hydroxyacid dehydrogenase NAD-binding protein [Myxococcales bacterium]|nr:D-isomer specific 2-hydroxyacid dehydrogenase NAD-binding protein [Myxococcales bacterium]
MRIVADANIPYVLDAFGPLGEVVTLPSGQLTAAAVREADLLLVRSTVKVGAPLLQGSRVKFVATATIGIDHLDTAWLDGAGVRWVSAPGSNADSVVQWFCAAMARVPDVAWRQLGIVGVGNVGGRIERLWRALEVAPPLLCDPPRARREGGGGFVALDEILARCDLVTLHVPLTRDGEDATFHLVDARRLREDAVLVNACRGEVLDSASVFAVGNRLLLDVFEGEPSPDPKLVARAEVATPHVAGHSLDGKANGTRMIYEAACAFLGVTPVWTPGDSLPPAPATVTVRSRVDGVAAVLEAVAAGYDVAADDAALRAIVDGPAELRGRAFRKYREDYPERRELDGRAVRLPLPLPSAEAMLNAYGVRVEPAVR